MIAMLVSLLTIAPAASPQTLFVSPSGNDGNPGTDNSPLRTISRAATLLRPGDRCVVTAGTYRETVVVPSNGALGKPIRFEAKGKVTLSGTNPVLDWTKLEAGVFTAPLSKLFDDEFQSDLLFQNGEPLNLLRWPHNTGTLANPTDARVVEAKDAGGDRIELKVEPVWDQPDGRWNGARVWVNLSRLGSNWGQDGQAQTGEVVNTNREKGTITVAGIDKRSWNDGKYQPDQPWGIGPGTEIYLFNPTPEGLAATSGPSAALKKGEWWWSSQEKKLYARPISGKPTGIESRKRSYAFDLSHRRDIVVDGFELFASTITTDRDAAKRSSSFADATRIRLKNLRGRFLTHFTEHTGQYQMQWLQKSGIRLSGADNSLESSVLEDVAGAAVCVIGRQNKVLGNTIRRANYSVSEAGCIETGRAYDPALTISQDHEIGFNTIEDSPQQGINIRALINSDPARPGLARVHHNIIRRVMTRAYDSGAIDQYGTNGQGVRIDHNLIQDLVGSLRIGIYIDFGSGYVIDHNVIHNVDRPIQVNWTDPKVPNKTMLRNNTALSVPGQNRLPGILNGVGQTNPESEKIYNLVSVRVSFGTDATVEGNTAVEDSWFANPGGGDFRLNRPVQGGAVPYGAPMFGVGASAYQPNKLKK